VSGGVGWRLGYVSYNELMQPLSFEYIDRPTDVCV
jgi:hypothetical protein